MTTQDTTTGALTWAVRDSLKHYVTKIAGGTMTVSDEVTETEGRFTFPLQTAKQTDDGWHLFFGGSARFVAHGGLLDVSISNPEVIIGSDGGALATQSSDDQDSMLPLVVLAPSQPTSAATSREWDAVETTLMASGVEIFGSVYEEGARMAPLRIVIEDLNS